jgi:hypothetical protein
MRKEAYMVYVLNKDGKPLMPTKRHGKVRHLLNSKKAKVVRREPFTIQLLYDSTNYTQELTLGIDTGSGTLGSAVSDTNGNIVYAAQVQVRNDITRKMTRRRKYRRTRRNRKTRYRKPRFLNRKNSIRTDRFSPTMISKIHSHIKEIESVKKILPIKNLVLETGQFDTALMKNPDLADPSVKPWGYQQGPNYGYQNTRARILDRDKHTCQHCHGKSKDTSLEVHHIIFRAKGGSNDDENLITLCHTCHTQLHNGEIELKLKGTKKSNLSYATQMNSIRKQLLRKYPEAKETFGYITKANRFNLNIGKDHYLDACVIASGGKAITFKTDTLYLKKDVAKGDYKQTMGKRSEKQIFRGKVLGFRKFDKVKYRNTIYFIKSLRKQGTCDLMDITGKKVNFSYLPRGQQTPKLLNCIRIQPRKTRLCIERRLAAIPPRI